jgi:hypothetical protein
MNANPKQETFAWQKNQQFNASTTWTQSGLLSLTTQEEALEKAKAAVAELNGLGLNYTLTDGAGNSAKAASGKGKGAIKAAACPICEFQTTPPHDGRTHRSQRKKDHFRWPS